MKPWEYKTSGTVVDRGPRTPEREDAIAELLHRYYLGEFTPQVRQRLEKIMQECPSDAPERLIRASEYVGVDGSRVEHYARLAMALWEKQNPEITESQELHILSSQITYNQDYGKRAA
jgi:hypothetical protein